jgi:hypothetical protein
MKIETMEKGAEKWVFETNGHKWSNNDDTAGDNFSSFIAGAKWQQEQAKEMELDKLKEALEIIRKFVNEFDEEGEVSYNTRDEAEIFLTNQQEQ